MCRRSVLLVTASTGHDVKGNAASWYRLAAFPPLYQLASFVSALLGLGICGCSGDGQEETQRTRQSIVGGEIAATCDWPSVVYYSATGIGSCTATLLAPSVIVLAAHCVRGQAGASVSFG